MLRALSPLALAAMLASCAGGPPRIPTRMIDRALANSNLATPGKVVAAELAFARAAREDGQWTAFRRFAGPDAVLHGKSGPFAAAPWLASQRDPAETIQWAPRSVWMSCDGALAVSRGRSRDADGIVGTFVTVWQRQADGEYRWIYDVGAPDVPQPPVKPQAGEGEILVLGDETVQGFVADCPDAADPLTPPPATPVPTPTSRSGGGASPDGTLRWRWEHAPDGTRRLVAEFFQAAGWKTALEQSFAP